MHAIMPIKLSSMLARSYLRICMSLYVAYNMHATTYVCTFICIIIKIKLVCKDTDSSYNHLAIISYKLYNTTPYDYC